MAAAIITTFLAALALLLFAAGPALAHGGLANYTVGDPPVWYQGWDPDRPAAGQDGAPGLVQRKWATIDPIFDALDPYIACNKPGTPPPDSIPIRAGENLTAVYWYWLHPVGPMTAWLAACNGDCKDVNVNKLDWFKIWEAGIETGTLEEGMWYQRSFQHWDGQPDLWPITIPATLKPGNYIVRHEILSIHIDYRPQFYPECAHLKVSGTGTALPPKEFYKKFPGAYDPEDPSIKISIYSGENKNVTTYKIPGGPVWDGWVDKYCVGC